MCVGSLKPGRPKLLCERLVWLPATCQALRMRVDLLQACVLTLRRALYAGTLTLGRLKLLCERLFRLPAARQALWAAGGPAAPRALDGPADRDLAFLGLQARPACLSCTCRGIGGPKGGVSRAARAASLPLRRPFTFWLPQILFWKQLVTHHNFVMTVPVPEPKARAYSWARCTRTCASQLSCCAGWRGGGRRGV